MTNISIILSSADAMELCAILSAFKSIAAPRFSEAPVEFSRLVQISKDIREQVCAKISYEDLDRLTNELEEEKKNREL